MKLSQQKRTATTGEVHSLLDKKVIHLAESQGGFVSNRFKVPKSSGKVHTAHSRVRAFQDVVRKGPVE